MHKVNINQGLSNLWSDKLYLWKRSKSSLGGIIQQTSSAPDHFPSIHIHPQNPVYWEHSQLYAWGLFQVTRTWSSCAQNKSEVPES